MVYLKDVDGELPASAFPYTASLLAMIEHLLNVSWNARGAFGIGAFRELPLPTKNVLIDDVRQLRDTDRVQLEEGHFVGVLLKPLHHQVTSQWLYVATNPFSAQSFSGHTGCSTSTERIEHHSILVRRSGNNPFQ